MAAQLSSVAGRLDRLYEFERDPVTPDRLHGGRYFAAFFAGEHVAATEFVIGAMFVQWGAAAADVVYGLLLGNLLAVLSWTFICAPIAVQTRLTLYWYARRILGPGLTAVYNLVNAVLYCCLAAAMIGVSASALIMALGRIPGLPAIGHPRMSDVWPGGPGWVAVVIAVGAVVVTLAILGFRRLSQFAAVCAPWMLVMFLAGAIASLPALGEVRTLGQVVSAASARIWTGRPCEEPIREVAARLPNLRLPERVPQSLRDELAARTVGGGPIVLSDDAVLTTERADARWRIIDGAREFVIKLQAPADGGPAGLVLCRVLPKLGFWHIAFFAWFANLAMHVGLSDMAVLRYAPHAGYGLYSAFGMFLGHFVAWLCAGVMAAALGQGLNIGQMADRALGTAGLVAVLLAGWTTANPTIYRAGLALQAITPDWPRWKITLAAGAITTAVACFPAIFMRLLDFVAIYGLVLMPVGAVIFTDHRLFDRLGLPRGRAGARGETVNVPALLTWAAVLGLCFPFEMFGGFRCPMDLAGIPLFFRWLPGWFLACGLYAALAWICWGRSADGAVEDRGVGQPPATAGVGAVVPLKAVEVDVAAWMAGVVALLALVMCLVLPLRVFLAGEVPEVYASNLRTCKGQLLVATVIYFVAASWWFGRRERARG